MGEDTNNDDDKLKVWNGEVVLEQSPYYESLGRRISPGLMREQQEDAADGRARYNAAIHAEYDR